MLSRGTISPAIDAKSGSASSRRESPNGNAEAKLKVCLYTLFAQLTATLTKVMDGSTMCIAADLNLMKVGDAIEDLMSMSAVLASS